MKKSEIVFVKPENFALTLELCWAKLEKDGKAQMLLCQKCIDISAPEDESMDRWVVVPVEGVEK